MRRLTAIVAAILIIAVGLSFAVLNSDDVTLNYYLGRLTMPLSLWMVISLALGALLGVLSTMAVIVRQRRELARLRRRVDESHRELSELRKLPIRNVP